MKRIIVCVASLLLVASIYAEEAKVEAVELVRVEIPEDIKTSITLDIVSAYVFKGATYNDGFVMQPSIEISSGALTIGGWINYDIDDYNETLLSEEVSEVDFYANYDIDLKYIGLSVGYCSFTYPHYDTYETEQELQLTTTLQKMFLSPFVTVKYGVDGALAQDYYYEAGGSYNLASLDIGALVAYADPYMGEAGLSHYEISLGHTIKPLGTTLSLTHLGLIDDDVLPRSTEGGGFDVNMVYKISMTKSF